jgi:AmmeMemoRadiSam system protein B
MSIRIAGNRGKFYPSQSLIIRNMICDWDDKPNNSKYIFQSNNDYKIAIVPHAGYIYSGYTAYSALKRLNRINFNKIVVIGPSHYLNIHGFSIAETEEFETPFGNLKNDIEMVDKIESAFDIDYSAKAHFMEHSTENQFPLIKYLFPDIKLIEIIYGQISFEILNNLLSFIMDSENTAMVISTDLSHFHELDVAIEIDKKCIESLEQLDPVLLKQCEACGKPGLLSILNYCSNNGKKVNIVDYHTSAEVTGDTSRVVGYLGAVI